VRRLRWGLLPLLAMLPLAGLLADDTDIYMSSIVPSTSVPLVMFTIDNSSSANATYGGCANVGTGAAMCDPAKYFAQNCATCVLPAATAPLTYFHVMRYAIRMILEQNTGFKAGLMLSHQHEANCTGPRPLVPIGNQRCSNGAYVARGFKLLDRVVVPGNALLGIPDTTAVGPNTQELLTILDSLPVPAGSVAHTYQGKELFFELFRYLTGQAVYNGHNGYADYGTTSVNNLNVDGPAYDWDASVELAGTTYVSPLTADLTCTKIFTINFVLGGSSQDNDSDAAINADTAGGMVGLDLSSPNDKFQNVVGYLYDVDLARAATPFGTVPDLNGKQNVTSYFYTVPSPANSNPPTFDLTTTTYAQQGGTTQPQAFVSTPATLIESLRSTIAQVLSVSTTFVSASVPVNVFSRTQVLNDVYLALFQPDIAAKPFWVGNVKKLKAQIFDVPCPLGSPADCTPGKEVKLVDALGNQAVDTDGRVKNSALTFWTDGSAIAANAIKGVQAGRDGRHVDRGGAGQKIPGYLSGGPGYLNTDTGARQMWLYPGSGTDLVAMNASVAASVTYQAPLGAADAAESLRLLKFIRGYDEYDADGDLVKTEVRPWLMADPLHSRPLAVNYGAWSGHSQANPAIFIAVATNDGVLHFIRNTTSGAAESGAEAWAFMPVEAMNVQKALAVNSPASKRLYGLDGTPTSLIIDVDHDGTVEPGDGDKVYLYFGMRRAGRAYYALDVTDPLLPRFLWKAAPVLSASGSTSASCSLSLAVGTALSVNSACAPELANLLCSGSFCELGYTFSQPRLARVLTGANASGQVVKRALVVGGGYDALANDYTAANLNAYKLGLATTGSSNGDDTMGNAIFVIDAETGQLIWKAVGPRSGSLPVASSTVFPHAGLKDSIPSTVTVVDTNSDGLTDRIVVGDTGGNLWRVDLGGDSDSPANLSATDDWEINLLAKLGRHASASGCSAPLSTATCKLNDRRFFHEPDYVLSQDELGPYDAIVIGSGDREDPLDYGRVRTLLPTVETTPENSFFVLKDYLVGTYSRDDSVAGSVLTPSSLADATDNCTQDLSIDRSLCTPNFASGWRLRLREGNGEKVLAGALTAANRVYFTSYLPPRSNEATTCGPSEGGGLFYALTLKKALAVFNYNIADCTSSWCSGSNAPNTARDRFESLTSAGIPAEVVYVNLPDASGNEVKCALGSDLNCRQLPGATRFRTFWYKDE
jgi:type IV pilus assembly protein PilY1